MGRSTRITRSRFIARCLAVSVLAVLAAGCSDDSGTPTVAPSSSAPGTPEVTAAPMTAAAGSLQGFLTPGQQQRAVDEVAAVVDGWTESAWVAGPWPRQIADVWPAFTPGAARKAEKDALLTSGAHYAERVSSVVPTRRELRVDLLAQQGTAHAATVRVVLNLDVVPGTEAETEPSEKTQKVVLRGRLFLTREDDAWTIFGYDLARGGW